MSIKKILLTFATLILLTISIILVRTFTISSQPTSTAELENIDLDGNIISQHLSEAIQFRTISTEKPEDINIDEFDRFIAWVKNTYPDLNDQLELTTINEYTLLYKWVGQDESLAPILLSSHYDVVPVIPGSEPGWTHPPYGGVIDDGHIWGRGSIDDKSAVISSLEATTVLIKQGFKPQRTIYIAATHDEEIGSPKGASGIATWMQEHNISLLWSLDEGSAILNDMLPGVTKPVASINVAEKGYINIELSVSVAGGHSSMPVGHTAVGILSTAIHNLQNNPLNGSLDGLSGIMFDQLAPHMPFFQKMLFANKWLFSGLIDSALSKSGPANAMIRTTMAPTMISGSVKSNILPIYATAIVSVRVHPKDTIDSIVKHTERAINDDRVSVKVAYGIPASKVSNHESAGFKTIANITKHIHGDVIVTPGLTVGGTDSKFYSSVSQDSFRFNPISLQPEDLTGFHGTNERLSIENLVNATEFYALLMKASASQ